MNKNLKIAIIGLPIICILYIGVLFFYNPLGFFLHLSPFKTQEIIYKNKENKNIAIEYQMQDQGAFGYNRRIVKVTEGILFDSVEKFDTSTIDTSKWIRIDKYVNEQKLKN